MRIRGRSATLVAGGLTTLLALCGLRLRQRQQQRRLGGRRGTLTLYNAQHEDLMKLMVAGFTKQTGIKVEMRNGDDFELANQIVQEGEASPGRRVPHRELPGDDAGRRRQGPSPRSTRPRSRRCPRSSRPRTATGSASPPARPCWSTTRPSSSRPQLPASILDLADPEWKGKVGIASAGADFQAIVSAVLALEGEAKAAAVAQGPEGQRQGLPRQQRRDAGGQRRRDPGGRHLPLLLVPRPGRVRREQQQHRSCTSSATRTRARSCRVSGAGVLASSKHQKQAQQFLAFLTGARGPEDPRRQRRPGVPDRQGRRRQPGAQAARPSSSRRRSTSRPLNGRKVIELMQQAGLL